MLTKKKSATPSRKKPFLRFPFRVEVKSELIQGWLSQAVPLSLPAVILFQQASICCIDVTKTNSSTCSCELNFVWGIPRCLHDTSDRNASFIFSKMSLWQSLLVSNDLHMDTIDTDAAFRVIYKIRCSDPEGSRQLQTVTIAIAFHLFNPIVCFHNQCVVSFQLWQSALGSKLSLVNQLSRTQLWQKQWIDHLIVVLISLVW